MAVNVKMGVDTSGFKSNIQDMTQQLKSFDAQLKYAEATMKATGSAEQGMLTKTNALTGKLETQKRMIQQYTQQLERMRQNGIDPMSKEYQKLQTALLNTSASMVETEAALNNLDKSQEQAAESADKLTQSVNGISKKVSLDQVISGVNMITKGLENAAKRAVELGEQLWSTIMDSASRADDTATLAEMFGIDIETYQKMQKLVTGGMDTTVESMLAAQDKLNRGIGKGSKEVMDVLRELNLLTVQSGKYGNIELIPEDSTALFWQAGQAIMAMSEAYDKEAAATALFGKSWKELKPLFDTYGSLEEYNEARDKQIVNDEQTIRDLAALNDAVGKLESSWTTLKDEMLGAIAPALTKGAEAVSGLLDKLTEYLKTDEGQEMLEKLGNSVAGLFDDLKNIDPEDVVNNFKAAFEKIVNSFTWLKDNWEDVKNALIAIAGGFTAIKLATVALNVKKVVDGLSGLIPGGGNTNGSESAAAAAGGSGGGGLLSQSALRLSHYASMLYEADATGVTALTGPVLMDQTTFGRHLRNGGGLKEAAEASIATIKASAEEGIGNFLDYFAEQLPNAFWGALGFENAEDAAKKFTENTKVAEEYTFGDDLTAEELMKIVSGEPTEMPVEPVAEEGAADDVAQQVGPVTLPAFLTFQGWTPGGAPDIPYFGNERGYANGLPFVPRDGLYLLHKGETVTPERGVGSRSYSSNLYVENMNMNSGMDAEGLAARMSAAQRRMLAGYGS